MVLYLSHLCTISSSCFQNLGAIDLWARGHFGDREVESSHSRRCRPPRQRALVTLHIGQVFWGWRVKHSNEIIGGERRDFCLFPQVRKVDEEKLMFLRDGVVQKKLFPKQDLLLECKTSTWTLEITLGFSFLIIWHLVQGQHTFSGKGWTASILGFGAHGVCDVALQPRLVGLKQPRRESARKAGPSRM